MGIHPQFPQRLQKYLSTPLQPILPSLSLETDVLSARVSGDVITTPSLHQLRAIARTTLRDDVYREDPTTIALERHVVALCGAEAAAFCLSGTMANQLGLRALLDRAPPHAILASADAHIIHWEAGGPALLSGASVQGIRPRNGKHLALADVQKHALLTDDVHKTPTAVVSVEVPSGGNIMPLTELRDISAWCHERGVLLHMDGSRLWEAVAAGAGSLSDYVRLCDAVCLDFSKSLGAPMGAVVVGSAALVHRVRRLRKAVGGGMRQAGVLAAAARAAIDEGFGSNEWGEPEQIKTWTRVHDLAKAVGEMWTRRGGQLLRDVETNMVWVDLKGIGLDEKSWNETGKKFGVKLDGKRIVLHRQISDEAIERLDEIFENVLKPRSKL